MISLYGNFASSVTAGNAQYDSSGILLAHSYDQRDASMYQYFSEVRNNLIAGEYDWSNGMSYSGIDLWLSASPIPNTPPTPPGPPILGYGVVIAHNTVTDADGLNGGAVDLAPSWWVGPATTSGQKYGATWDIADNTLIYGNSISENPPPGSAWKPTTRPSFDRAGISLIGGADNQPVAWRSVLYANSCRSSRNLVFLVDRATGTVRYCPSVAADSCECARIQSLDLEVEATGLPSPVATGQTVTYSVTLINHSSLTRAHRIALYATLPAGIRIDPASLDSARCDSNVAVCRTSLAPASQQTLIIGGVATAEGIWPVTFSAVDQDTTDANMSNNGVVVTTTVTGPSGQ